MHNGINHIMRCNVEVREKDNYENVDVFKEISKSNKSFQLNFCYILIFHVEFIYEKGIL